MLKMKRKKKKKYDEKVDEEKKTFTALYSR